MNILLQSVIPYIDAILAIGLMIGGILAMRSGRRQALAQIQEQTISALQSQIGALQARASELERTCAKQEFVIETMQLAMKSRGLVVTIDGDMVTIADSASGKSTSRRKTAPAPSKARPATGATKKPAP